MSGGPSAPLPWSPPDYGGDCLSQVLPSALAALMRVDPTLPVPAADRIVVLLIDGLGHHQLPIGAKVAPFLSAMTPLRPGGIDTAFPSTTATALTSLGTGLPPGRHGIVGAAFWLPDLDGVLSPLGWRDKPNAVVVQPEPTVFDAARKAGIAATVVGPRAFSSGGLTAAALRGARYVGADSPGELIMAIPEAASAAAPTLVYGYIGEVDKTGHIHGVGSQQWLLDLQWTDRAVAAIAERLPAGTLLLVTADHGMVNCPDAARIDIDGEAFGSGVRRIAGEPRMRQVYLRPGASAERVADRWQHLLADRAVVVTRQRAVAAGLFGQVGYGMSERIGDVLALPVGDFALVSQKVDSIVSGLRGQHGGLTDPERRVPLLAWAR